MRHLAILGALFFLLVSIAPLVGAGEPATGVVLLHGKSGSPGLAELSEISAKFRKAGFIVVAPEMPYSRDRGYDKTYDEALTEVDTAVESLKKAGAGKIVVAGHSMGANVALYYGGTRSVDGIVALAPGHRPESRDMRERLAGSVEKARTMIEQGQGDRLSVFDDSNQGKVTVVRTTPAIYLSWFDPAGKAVMSRSTRALRPGTPLMWVIGTRDPLFALGPAYAFDRAPKEIHNAYVVVEADHSGTPAKAAGQVVAWIKGLGNKGE